MRIITNKLKDYIEQCKDFIYCFEITLLSGQKLCLSSADCAICVNDIVYLPNSGLNIISGQFNDSACNHIILDGIFEDVGIELNMDLTDAKIKILIYFSNSLYHLLTYYCSSYTKYDLNFRLYLESEAKKYNQSLLKSFSKSCRAKLYDKSCGVNNELYTYRYNIKDVIGNFLTLVNCNKDSGYFDNGSAIFDSAGFCAMVLKHNCNIIELDKAIPRSLSNITTITIIAACDKNFITCCNKFDNAVNFRGEPFVPMSNLLKNLHE